MEKAVKLNEVWRKDYTWNFDRQGVSTKYKVDPLVSKLPDFHRSRALRTRDSSCHWSTYGIVTQSSGVSFYCSFQIIIMLSSGLVHSSITNCKMRFTKETGLTLHCCEETARRSHFITLGCCMAAKLVAPCLSLLNVIVFSNQSVKYVDLNLVEAWPNKITSQFRKILLKLQEN